LPEQQSTSVDSSRDSTRGLRGLMSLARKAATAQTEQRPENDPLDGAIPAVVLRSLLGALQFHDASTVQHSRRVAQLAVGMARHLQWEGRHSCPQAAFSRYQHVVRRELGIADDQVVICGLALGYADPDAVPNNLITERAPIADFTTWFTE